MLDVCVLGCSGMQPLPTRHLASAMFRYDGKSILIDCGEGTQVAIKKKGWSFKTISVICFTHYHTDHIGGLAGLLASMNNSEKTDELTIIGPVGLEKVVNAALVMAPKLLFPIKLVRVVEPTQALDLLGVHLEMFTVDHNVPCYGYSLSIQRNGKFDNEKAKKYDVPEEVWNEVQQNGFAIVNGKVYVRDMLLGEERKGIKVTYCTDTRPTASIIEGAKESDLFICEGMYGTEADYTNAIRNKHMLFSEAAKLAKQADVKEMWLTHYSPSLVNPKVHLEEATKIFENTKLSKCGMSVTLGYEN